MIKKHAILLAIIIALVLQIIATVYYPGGSQYDKNSVGFDWRNNYRSNLFAEKAVNGLPNPARFWAIFGMLFLCIGFALFFIDFSKKIPEKGASKVIRHTGAGAMVFAFLAATPLHDIAVIIACTLALISMFYITVFVFKSKLHLFKILSVLCMLSFYCANYMYYTRHYLELLPIMQKIVILITITWVLTLQYFTTAEDFKSRQKAVTPIS